MTRRITDLLHTQFTGPGFQRLAEENPKRAAAVRASVPLRITLDISDLIAVAGRDFTDTRPWEYESIIPPWSLSLTEWELTPDLVSRSNLAQASANDGEPIERYGVLAHSAPVERICVAVTQSPDIDDAEVARWERWFRDHPEARIKALRSHGHDHLTDEVLASIGHHVAMWTYFTDRNSGSLVGPTIEVKMLLDHQGHLINGDHISTLVDEAGRGSRIAVWVSWADVPRSREWAALFPGERYDRNDLLDTYRQVVPEFIHPALYAWSLANLTNVRTSEREPRYASRQQRRAAERSGQEMTRYHVLEIGPPGSKDLTKYRPMAEVMREMALHGVRGHFACYGDSCPGGPRGRLFGKYEGRFWVRPHLRGSAEAGVIEKEYVETAATLGITPA